MGKPTGFLEFNIVPNDWPGPPSTAATDYDFAIWRTKTAGVPGPANCGNLGSTIFLNLLAEFVRHHVKLLVC